MKTGSCLCGGVTFELDDPIRNTVACHCTQCRKTSGHYWAATKVPNSQFHLLKSDSLQWYQSSDTARRGFCNVCGSSLFWQKHDENATAVGSGSLHAPTGMSVAKHIFVEDKGDYYDLE